MSQSTSVMISRLLNDLGYSQEMVKLRQKAYESAYTEDESFHGMICGSKREGLSLLYENDLDEMLVKNHVECRDVFDDISRNDFKIKFQLVRDNSTAPGYTLLKYVSPDVSALPDEIRACLVKVDDLYFLSSDRWRQKMKEALQQAYTAPGITGFVTICRDTQGPSCPKYDSTRLFKTDTVNAIPYYYYPEVIDSWRNRRRLQDWPSPDLIATVSSLEAHVVPIGYKGSPQHSVEWRICFTKAEIRLIESLNDCQTKLIILLKMIAKHVLQPICEVISSYVMKNLVLWMAEKFPTGLFVEHELMASLELSLEFLKSCIKHKDLPSFMIEGRNLFADRLSESQIVALVETIDELLGEGPAMLLRCPKIRQGLTMRYQFPEQFRLLSKRRKCLVLLTEKYFMKYRQTLCRNNQCGVHGLNQIIEFILFSGVFLEEILLLMNIIYSFLCPDIIDVFKTRDNPVKVWYILIYLLS